MAAIVTFRGSTVIADGEGAYEWVSVGWATKREYSVATLARGLGVVPKDLGTRGAMLVMRFAFTCKDSGAGVLTVSGLGSRIAALLTPVMGSLVTPDLGTFTNCVLTDVQEVPPKRIKTIGTTPVTGYDRVVELSWLQARA